MAADKITMTRTLIEEAGQRWQGLARFLERSGMDHNAELIGWLAARAGRWERRARYIAEARAGRR